MKNKFTIIITSVIVLIPMLVGVAFWDALPEQVAIHWGASGEPDGWCSKAFAVYAVPLIMVALHWACLFATRFDKKNRNQNPKMMNITYWLVPAVSWVANGMTYADALGKDIDVIRLLPIIMGALFLLIGNYLPKCTPNRTVGIRIKWTLADEENWNATHRFGGKVWFIGAIVILASSLLPAKISVCVMIAATLAMALAPIIYSYCFYKKKKGK